MNLFFIIPVYGNSVMSSLWCVPMARRDNFPVHHLLCGVGRNAAENAEKPPPEWENQGTGLRESRKQIYLR
ncbi:MAG: hypothetical protein IKP54_03300 [Bacteroidales bacterium]|nr:hypothetical protein [Bacteroidales bacterium]